MSSMLFYFITISWVLSLFAITNARPVTRDDAVPKRQSILVYRSISTPLGIEITDLDLGDISPIEDGWLELDSDDGDGNDNGSTSVSNANGYLGSVGSGQASENNNGNEGTSAACGLLSGCVTSAAASNGNQASTSSASTSGLINGPLIGELNVENN